MNALKVSGGPGSFGVLTPHFWVLSSKKEKTPESGAQLLAILRLRPVKLTAVEYNGVSYRVNIRFRYPLSMVLRSV